MKETQLATWLYSLRLNDLIYISYLKGFAAVDDAKEFHPPVFSPVPLSLSSILDVCSHVTPPADPSCRVSMHGFNCALDLPLTISLAI